MILKLKCRQSISWVKCEESVENIDFRRTLLRSIDQTVRDLRSLRSGSDGQTVNSPCGFSG